jgi:hypothetical protein
MKQISEKKKLDMEREDMGKKTGPATGWQGNRILNK